MSDHLENIFFEIHRENPREGPGNFASTKRAYSLLKDLPANPTILDIGCGPGQQTIDLAHLCEGDIYAIDTHKPFLESLQKKINELNLRDRIFPRHGDMASLQYKKEYFDIIWAEGSAYIMGFENGLAAWKPFLKRGGYVAITEISWLKPDPPQDLTKFWKEAYPAMQDIEGNIYLIKKTAYRYLDHFVLPVSAWWDDYYSHIENKISELRSKYHDNPQAQGVLEGEQNEIELFRKYHMYYGYVFYIMQKPRID